MNNTQNFKKNNKTKKGEKRSPCLILDNMKSATLNNLN